MGEPLKRDTENRDGATTRATDGVREGAVQHAVAFLNDPRVRASDLHNAVAFLRSQGILETEIQQAFARTGLIFPPAPNGQPRHFEAHKPRKQSSSWWPILIGVATAAVLYNTAREILRQYVVPLYFPDTQSQQAGSSSNRNINRSSSEQDQKLSRLTERVDALAQLSQRTTDSVDRLASVVEATQAKNKQTDQILTELCDVVKTLSNSVSTSLNDERGTFKSDVGYLNSLGQTGSGSVTMVDTRRSVGGFGQGDANTLTSVSARVNGSNEREDRQERDEFLEIAPAEVQDDWRCMPVLPSLQDPSSRTIIISENEAQEETSEKLNAENANGRSPLGTTEPKDTVDVAGEEGVGDSVTAFADPGPRTERKWTDQSAEGSEKADLINNGGNVYRSGSGPSMNGYNYDGNPYAFGQSSAGGISAARMLFEADVLEESRRVFNEGSSAGRRERPMSMPTLDAPLSDVD